MAKNTSKSAAKRVSAAEAKAQLSTLVARVAFGGEHYVIERRGKPLATLVSVDDLERIEQGQGMSTRPLGALALIGAWREVENAHLDAVVAEIDAERSSDTGRPVELSA